MCSSTVRLGSLAIAVLLALPLPTPAAGWSAGLFDHLSHDFGQVPRGAVVKHTFRIINKLRDRVHIASVRPSCPICTVAAPEKRWLEPGETAEIVATVDTGSFTGPRSVSITVSFDYPSFDQTRLVLRCYSRPDLVITPGVVSFGTVRSGAKVSRTVRIEYAGNSAWQVRSVRAVPRELLSASARELYRTTGRVGYELTVTLRAGERIGPVTGIVTVDATDGRQQVIDIPVEGQVVGIAVLSRHRLYVGLARPGQKLRKTVLLRATQPVRVVRVETGPGPFRLSGGRELAALHRLTVEFDAPHKPGIHTQLFLIHLRAGDGRKEVHRFEATATVVTE